MRGTHTRRGVPERVLCFACGNPATPASDLVYTEERGRRVIAHDFTPCDDAVDAHGVRVYPDDDPDTPIPVCGHVECQEDWDPCPPLPNGFGSCEQCNEARPLHTLQYVTQEGRRPTSIPAHRSPGDTTVAYSSMTASPAYACLIGGCAARRKEAAKYYGKQERDEDTPRRDKEDEQASADQARADAVPADGEGLAIVSLMAVWDVSERTAERIVRRLLDTGLLRYEEVATRAGGRPRRLYWRVER